MVHKNMKVRITKEMEAKKGNLSLLCINKTQIKTISGGNYAGKKKASNIQYAS